jgi:acetyltransferase-like isoleucine patch superfamily enzyme
VFWSVGVLSMNDNGFGSGGELRPPHVAQGASIGGGAVLLPGVHVGEDAIIGAGSVVTKDVASSTKVMGVPAREKRESDREVSESYYFGSFYPEELPDRPYSEGELYEELGR